MGIEVLDKPGIKTYIPATDLISNLMVLACLFFFILRIFAILRLLYQLRKSFV